MALVNEQGMFPVHARKAPRSLVDLAKGGVKNLVLDMCEDKPHSVLPNLRQIRKTVRRNLPFHLITDMFNEILTNNRWTHPCSDGEYGYICQIHKECRVISSKLQLLIHVLFSEDVQYVNINLRKVKSKYHEAVIDSLKEMLKKIPRRDFKLLTSFVIKHGGIDLILSIEELTHQLQESAQNLVKLHLPVASNTVLSKVAQMKSLRIFVCDKSKRLTSRGIGFLCARGSISKYQLEVLHIGIFKHPGFTKDSSTKLLRFMENLKEVSFNDQDRYVSRSPWYDDSEDRGAKVLTYSVFKLAIKQHEMKDNIPWPGGRIGPDLLATNLRTITVVDRVLKPHYILESASKCTNLTLDWQEDYRAVSEIPRDWFHEMIGKQTWVMLASRLTHLSVTFPAAYMPNAYSLPPQDFVTLLRHLGSLNHLKLVGAGNQGPLPLMSVLEYCPSLESLVLEMTPIHVPHQDIPIRREYIHRKLKKFHLIDELSSLTFHPHLTGVIAAYLPGLQELDISPEDVEQFDGFTCIQILELSRLPELQRLGITFSTRDCTSNMPQVVYTLKEFPSLRNLVISWGKHNADLFTMKYLGSHLVPVHMVTWLEDALKAFNANINMQVSIKHHFGYYQIPGVSETIPL